jgi:tRNA (cytidine/uridine-2'-O-)-methyltransferase
MSIRLALFEPDIPQNAGTIIRLAACLGVAVDLIEPAGFLLGDRQFRRAGLDYLALATLRRFPSWRAYRAGRGPGRLLLLTTRGDEPYVSFRFRADDVLLLGRESAGVPDAVHAAAEARLRVPMLPGARSLNVAVAAAMVLGEALRQTGGFPAGEVTKRARPGAKRDPAPTRQDCIAVCRKYRQTGQNRTTTRLSCPRDGQQP